MTRATELDQAVREIRARLVHWRGVEGGPDGSEAGKAAAPFVVANLQWALGQLARAQAVRCPVGLCQLGGGEARMGEPPAGRGRA